MADLDTTPVTAPQSQGSGGTATTGQASGTGRSSLRRLSYKAGAAALQPDAAGALPVANAGLAGPVQLAVVAGGSPALAVDEGAPPTTTTTADDPNAAVTTEGGDKETPAEPKSELEQVRDAHALTIEALVQELKDLRGHAQKVFKARKKKAAATDAKAIFGMLAQYDSQTITAAWQLVGEQDVATEFEMLVDAIGYKDAARSFPREARATLAACAPARLVAFAEDVAKKNPFAAQLAVGVMPEAEQTAFGEKHPELGSSKKITEKDQEKLDTELLTLKDDALRKDEEGFRKRVDDGAKDEAKKDELAQVGAADAGPLVERVNALIVGGKHHDALVALADEGNDGVFLAATRSLDTGALATLIAGLSFDEKWNQSPQRMKRVFAARAPDKNLEDARRLLDVEHLNKRARTDEKGKTKVKKVEAITSEEAYAAFQFLKALPAAHRELFQKTYPDLAASIELHMNGSMRKGDDTNYLGAGGGDQETIAQLVVKVGDDALWFEAPPDQLDMTLRMVIKAGRRDAIAKKLTGLKQTGQLAQLHGDAARRSMVESALGIVGEPAAVPDGMTPAEHWVTCLKLSHTIEKTDESLDHAQYGFGKGGAGRALVHANRATRSENREEKRAWKEAKRNGEEVGEKPDAKNPSLLKQIGGALGKKEVKVENFALDEAQSTVDAYGGDMEFKDFGERKGAGKDEDRNRADLSFDHNAGVFDFECPHLELVRLRYPYGDMVVETGPVLMKGVRIHATWPTPQNPAQASYFSVVASSLDIQHVMVTQPGALIGISHIEAGDISYVTGEQKIDFSDNPGADQVLKLLKENNPARSIITFGLQTYQGKDVANDNIEALTQAFIGKPSGSLGGMALDIGNVTASGITYNAGVFVQEAKIDGLSLVWDNRPSVSGRARVTQLEGMVQDGQTRLAALPEGESSPSDAKKRERLTGDIARWSAERDAITGKLPGWEKLEKVYQELYEHQKLNGGAAGENSEAVLRIQQAAVDAGIDGALGMSLVQLATTVQQRLTADSGLVLSVDQVGAKGVDADGTQVEEASITGINVSGQGETFGEAVDPKLNKRLGAEDGVTKGEGKPIGTSVDADVAQIEVKGVTLAGSIPSADKLKELVRQLEELRAKVDPLRLKPEAERGPEEKKLLATDGPKLDALETQWKKPVLGGDTYGRVVEEMLGLDAAEGQAKIQSDATLLAQWKELGKKIQGEPTTIASVVALGLSAKGETVTSEVVDGDRSATTTTSASTLTLGSLEATGIKSGDTEVGSASLTGIKGSATTTSLTEKDASTGESTSQTTGSGNLTVESGRASKIAIGGATIEEAGLDNVTLGVTTSNDETALELGIGKVYTKGVGLQKGIAFAEARRKSLTASIADAKSQGKATDSLELELKRLEGSLEGYRAAYATQDVVEGELKAIDAKLEAAGQRLAAAEKEAAVFKHRVDRGEEEGVAEADKRRIDAIKAEIATLKQERTLVALKLGAPQGVIASFESELGVEGESSVSDIKLSVAGAPGIDQLTQKGGPDLSGDIKVALSAGPVVVPTVNYAAPSMSIALGGAKMDSFVAEATVSVVKQPQADGKVTYGLGGIAIQGLAIPSIVGNNLRITLPVEGELLEIALPTATLTSLQLQNVHLAGFDAKSLETATGTLDVASIQTSLSATMGESLSANGSLSLSALHAEALSSGALNFGLGDLTLDKLGFSQTSTAETAAGNSIVTQIVKMGGKASKLGKVTVAGSYDRVGKALSTTVGLGDLTLSGIQYAGAGTSLGVGYAALEGASVTVKAQFKQGEVKPGESSLESLVIDELKASHLRGSQIHYVGTGTQKERFEDGTEKTHPVENEVHLKSGNLHQLSVRGLKLIGEGPTAFGMSLGSGSVDGLKVGLEKDGKSLLQANVSASVTGVSVSLVDDELSADVKSIDGSVSATMGQGDGAMNVDLKDIHADQTHVDVHDMGKQTQSMDATVATLTAKGLSFEQGIKGTGYNKPTTLGGARLNGVTFHDDHDKMSVDVKDGTGLMVGAVEVTHGSTGSSDLQKSQATDDQIVVPLHKVTWTRLAPSTLDGFLKLNYPDESQFLRLNFAAGGVTLDLQANIDRMWGEWLKGFESNGESAFAYMWKAASNALKLPGNVLWTALFSGLEMGFNFLGKKILGDWPAIEKTILESLNSSGKTSIVKGYKPAEGPQVFTSFTDSINEVIQQYVEPAIQTICDTGVIYDAVQGDWGRAAKTTGTWLLEQTGDLIDWGGSWFGKENTTDLDDKAVKDREKMRAQRRAELESMVKSGLAQVLGWGAELDLHSQGGVYKADKEPTPDPQKKGKHEMLSTGIGLDIGGGGTLKGLSLGTKVGLSNLRYSDAGSTASVTDLTLIAGASGGVNTEWEDDGLKMKHAGVGGAGGVYVKFSGLHYEMDKNWLPQAPAGIETDHERYKRHGTTSNSDSPVSDGNSVSYDAGDYAHRVNTGQGVYGEQYSEELSLKEQVTKGVVQHGTDIATGGGPTAQAYSAVTGQTIGTTAANHYEKTTVAAKNAVVYGKYEEQWQQQQDAKKKKAAD